MVRFGGARLLTSRLARTLAPPKVVPVTRLQRRSTKLFPRAILPGWHLNPIRRSTGSGRNTADRFRNGTTSRSRAGWPRRSASSKARRGGCRIRSSAPTGWGRNWPTTGRSGSSGWPRRRRPTRNRPAAARRFCRCSPATCARSGLICQHCNETLVPFDEIADDVRAGLDAWAKEYEPVHAVAHWDDHQRRRVGNYDAAYRERGEGGRTIPLPRRPRTGAEIVESLIPPSSGRTRTNAWKYGPRTWQYDLRF